jgi:hypothetical protein
MKINTPVVIGVNLQCSGSEYSINRSQLTPSSFTHSCSESTENATTGICPGNIDFETPAISMYYHGRLPGWRSCVFHRTSGMPIHRRHCGTSGHSMPNNAAPLICLRFPYTRQRCRCKTKLPGTYSGKKVYFDNIPPQSKLLY